MGGKSSPWYHSLSSYAQMFLYVQHISSLQDCTYLRYLFSFSSWSSERDFSYYPVCFTHVPCAVHVYKSLILMHISLQVALCSYSSPNTSEVLHFRLHGRDSSLLQRDTHLHMESCDRDRLVALSTAPALSVSRLPSSRCSWLAAPSSQTSCVRSSSHCAANV